MLYKLNLYKVKYGNSLLYYMQVILGNAFSYILLLCILQHV